MCQSATMNNIVDELIYFRKSRRAKQVIFRVNPLKGIEVVVPKGVFKHQLDKIILEKSESIWFKKAVSQLTKYRKQLTPDTINLGCSKEKWIISYETTAANSVPHILETDNNRIQITTNSSDAMCHIDLLHKWLQVKAENVLVPLVRNISSSTNIRFKKVKIKFQKNSWGTCSIRKNINLNRNLIFLPDNLIEYVILHELCHIKFLNHSLEFWELLEKYVPDWKIVKEELKHKGGILIPAWAMV